ncbi:MAG: radical SAM/SPASM domain-containing protein [Bacteroidota bacterium]
MTLLLTRGLNLFKIVASYLFSRIIKKPVHWGTPVAASIEPVNSCNLRCPECPAGMKVLTRARGTMQPELFKSIIGQLSPRLSYLTLYFQGEPYMSSHFFDFVAIARKEKIFVSTSTNGHFLGEKSVHQTISSGLNRLIISLDGADQQSYEAYRAGGDFSKVIAGTRLLVNERKRLKSATPEIILQCLVLKSNEHQLAEIKKLGRELGVDKVTFKTAQFNDYEHGNPLMPDSPKHTRYTLGKDIPGSIPAYTLKIPRPDSCFRMWSSCVFTWDGKVVPCCFDKDATHELGDMTRQTFEEIWKGDSYNSFRKKILESRKSIDICSNCSQTF